MKSSFKSAQRAGRAASVLTMTLALGAFGMLGSTAVQAQATSGTIFGAAPAGQTVTVQGNGGPHRHATVNAKGRYSIGALPMGVYKVALEKDGKAVDTRSNINVSAGRGAEIDFACEHDQCAAAN